MLAAPLALLHSHRSNSRNDLVSALENRISSLEKLSDKALLYGALFCWVIGDIRGCESYARQSSSHPDSQPLLALIDKEPSMIGTDSIFSGCIEFRAWANIYASRDIEYVHSQVAKLPAASIMTHMLSLDSAIICGPSWNHLQDALERLSAFIQANGQPYPIDLYVGKIVYHSCHEYDPTVVEKNLSSLLDKLKTTEPGNFTLFCKVVDVCLNLTCSNNAVSTILKRFVDEMEQNWASDYDVQYTVGRYYRAMEDTKTATEKFKKCLDINKKSIDAMCSIAECLEIGTELELRLQDIEITSEVLGVSRAQSQRIALLRSRVLMRQSSQESRLQLNTCVRLLSTMLEYENFSWSIFASVSPDFLNTLFDALYCTYPISSVDHSFFENDSDQGLQVVVDVAKRMYPGHPLVRKFALKSEISHGDWDQALVSANQLSRVSANSSHSDYFLICDVLIAMNRGEEAGRMLDSCVGQSFEARTTAYYHYLTAQIHRHKNTVDSSKLALQEITQAISICADQEYRNRFLYVVEQWRILRQMRLHVDAKQAIVSLLKTSSRLVAFDKVMLEIMLAETDLDIGAAPVDTVVVLLETLMTSFEHDSVACVTILRFIAKIHLNNRHDQAKYLDTLQKASETLGSKHPNCMVEYGDALMKCSMAETGLKVYRRAIDLASRGDGKQLNKAALHRRVGSALVKSHLFSSAISYYQDVISSLPPTDCIMIIHDLSFLYHMMNLNEEAVSCLSPVISMDVIHTNLEHGMARSKALVLYSKLLVIDVGKTDSAIDALEKAQMQFRGTITSSGNGLDVNPQLTEILNLKAKLLQEKGDNHKCKSALLESLSLVADDKTTQLLLAKLLLQQGDVKEAQIQCLSILKLNANDQETMLLLTQILIRERQFTDALSRIRSFLEKHPTNWDAFELWINLLRRCGNVIDSSDSINSMFLHAEKLLGYESVYASSNSIDSVTVAAPGGVVQSDSQNYNLEPVVSRAVALNQSVSEAGYHYCRALLYTFYNRYNEALKEFNCCRNDERFGEKSTAQMIKIYLNPDNDTLVDDGQNIGQMNLSTLQAVHKLLKWYPNNKQMSTQYRVLEANVIMSTRQKTDIDRAIALLNAISGNDNVQILLSLATAFVYLKDFSRAKVILKKMSQVEWSMNRSEDFESAWLLLADIYIQNGKYDSAKHPLKLCTTYNQSCYKAFEYLGMISEKTGDFKEAAACYQQACILGQFNDQSICLKLAHSYLKSGMFVDAVDVCHKILKLDPDCPKVRKEVMERARMSMRVPV